MINIILSLILAYLCAYAYRFGGCSKEEGHKKFPWAPMWIFRSWVRDFGCSFLTTLWMFICFARVPWFVYLVSFGFMWGMLTTYWDSLFGYDNHWFHGFMVGFAFIGYAIFSGLYLWFAIYAIVLAVAMGTVSVASSDVDVEEFGRGAAIGLTLTLISILARFGWLKLGVG